MGTAYLVGAGPGDPGLLTRRGAELLRRADVVLHDALVDHGMLALASPRAEIVDVGRRAGESRSQEALNHLLVELARHHNVVVRLKGGDPLVFGRGGEEALALRAAGVPFEIVPGVTSGVGALAYAGIPLTHRGLATSAVFVTAHEGDARESEEQWRHIAGMRGTVVVYMGGQRIREVTERLIRYGRSPGTPAAVVEWGTLPRQRVEVARLDELSDRAGDGPGPQLIVIGEVVTLHERLGWVPWAPLSGRTVLVARAREQRSWTAASLRGLGASVIEFPSVRSAPAGDPAAVARAVAAHAPGGAIVFSGAAGVKGLLRALARAGLDARSLAGSRLVALGRETIATLHRAHLGCDVPVRSYETGRLVAALGGPAALAWLPVLLVGDGGPPCGLGEGLAAAGAVVTRLEVARRRMHGRGRQNLERLIARGELDAAVLPSSSAVEALAATGLALGPGVRVVAIGPATATTALALGLPPARVPERPCVDALVTELLAVLDGGRAPAALGAPGPGAR